MQVVKDTDLTEADGLEAGEYLYGFKKDSKLNPLVTFVLYSGKDTWEGPNHLHDMLDFSDIPDCLKEMVSDYKINVIDIRKFENTEVFQTDVKHVFDFIRCSEDKKKLVELVENDVYYTQMDEEAFDVVTKYANAKQLVKAKEYQVEGGKRNMCKAIKDLMDDSREEGREQMKLNFVENMLRKGMSDEDICALAECDIEFVNGVKARR